MTNVNVRGLGGQRFGAKVEIQRFASVAEFEQVSRTRVMDALPFPHARHATSAGARVDVRSANLSASHGMVRVHSHLPVPEPDGQLDP